MLTSYRKRFRLLWLINRRPMEQRKNEVLPGILDYTGRGEADCRRRRELAVGVRNHDPLS
jgi:hypothetical protein